MVPMLVTLLAGVLEFGRILDAWVVVSNAARQGGRIAALGEPASEVQDQVVAYLASSFGARTDVQLPEKADVRVVNAQGLTGDAVTVVVPAYVEVYVPLIKDLILTNPFTVTGKIAMRIE
ncbi:MAG: pilus assembly protein [Chloroflexi bacterium]|nr:pilus assembly protein [Chloroflexota bacterium]